MLTQKSVFTVFVALMLLVSVAPAFVIAEEGSDSNSDSGNTDSTSETDSSSDDSNTEDSNDEDEEDRSGSNSGSEDELNDDSEDEEDEDNSGRDRERVREEFKSEFTTADGKRVEVERKIEIEDGKRKIVIIRKVTNPDGTVSEYKMEIVEKDGKRVVKFEGRGDFDVETDLEIDQGENESDLEATTSDGVRHKIIILPDRASEVAVERLKSMNFTVELREVRERNVPRVVYIMESNKDGRFLGILKMKVKVEGQIDPETGELIEFNKPWWAFLVAGEDDADETFTEDTTTEEEIVDEEEGEDESGDEETEDTNTTTEETTNESSS